VSVAYGGAWSALGPRVWSVGTKHPYKSVGGVLTSRTESGQALELDSDIHKPC